MTTTCPTPLPGMPADPTPPPTAADLVRAWCEAWSRTHQGRQPDASVVRRVAGICKAVAKDRTDLDSWRDAWRAAARAGVQGRYDVIGELAAVTVTPSGRANHYLDLARQTAEQAPLSLVVGGQRQVGAS